MPTNSTGPSDQFEESEFLYREPCPECGSKDNVGVYSDGHKHCFTPGCDHHTPPTGDCASGGERPTAPKEFDPIGGEYRSLTKRRISERTCRKFGYRIAKHFDGSIQVADVRDLNGQLVGQKCRTRDKDFFVVGKAAGYLIGAHLWSGGKRIVVVEGEIDMLSYAEIVDCKWPVVSIPLGADSAKKTLKKNMDYLLKFDEVVLMFDMDEPGQAAAIECLPMFPPGRCKVAKLPRKDANECLVEGEAQQVVNAVFNAEAYKPSHVVTVDEIYERCLIAVEMGLSFPWQTATRISLGIRRGEIHIVGAAPKIGKTEHQHQLLQHMTEVHGINVGVMSLEENPVKTAKKIAGKYMKKQFTKPKEVAGWTDEELKEGMNRIRGKIQFYSSEGVRDYEEILNTIRWWAAEGIWFFIIDPLTALVAEHDSSSANDILNEFMSKAASMCQELQITMFMYSHVNPVKTGVPHDQGGRVLSSQFTGSRAMEKWAHYGWGIRRNRNHEDPIQRNTATVELLFDREFGEWVEYDCFYNTETNDWSEVASAAAPFAGTEESY